MLRATSLFFFLINRRSLWGFFSFCFLDLHLFLFFSPPLQVLLLQLHQWAAAATRKLLLLPELVWEANSQKDKISVG